MSHRIKAQSNPFTLAISDRSRCNKAQRRVARRSEEPLALLAFHPDRCDSGPGCANDANDAGHYSVRSPLPTVQLLREADLEVAREQWASRRPDEPHPGALGLLLENKQKLRQLGTERLRDMLDECSNV